MWPPDLVADGFEKAHDAQVCHRASYIPTADLSVPCWSEDMGCCFRCNCCLSKCYVRACWLLVGDACSEPKFPHLKLGVLKDSMLKFFSWFVVFSGTQPNCCLRPELCRGL